MNKQKLRLDRWRQKKLLYLYDSLGKKKKKKTHGEEAAAVTDMTRQSQLVVIHYVSLLSNELCCICSSVTASCRMPSDTAGSGWPSTLSSLLEQAGFLHPSAFQLCSTRLPTILQFCPSQTLQIRRGLKSCFCSPLNRRLAQLKVKSCPNWLHCVCVYVCRCVSVCVFRQ